MLIHWHTMTSMSSIASSFITFIVLCQALQRSQKRMAELTCTWLFLSLSVTTTLDGCCLLSYYCFHIKEFGNLSSVYFKQARDVWSGFPHQRGTRGLTLTPPVPASVTSMVKQGGVGCGKGLFWLRAGAMMLYKLNGLASSSLNWGLSR